jgi:hypothetical protein
MLRTTPISLDRSNVSYMYYFTRMYTPFVDRLFTFNACIRYLALSLRHRYDNARIGLSKH